MVSYLGICLFLGVVSGCFGQNPYARSSAQAQASAQANSGYPNFYNGGVYRPCPNLNPSCISQYLAQNSNCRIPNAAAAREPFFVAERQYELPSINTTFFRFNIEYSNILSGRIEEFFIDYVSGYTVLSIDYTDLSISSEASRYELNRRANIPLVFTTPTYLVYPGVAVTTVFPTTNSFNLANSRSTGFFDTFPQITFGAESEITRINQENIASTGIEAFSTTAPLVNRFFIQNLLCDYGIRPNQFGLDA